MHRLVLPLVLAVFAVVAGASRAGASVPPKIVGFGPDLITVLTKAPVKDKRSGLFEGVELQGEVASETVAATNGWRSMRAVLDVNCSGRLDRVREMTVFSEHNGKGEAKALTPPPEWIEPGHNTTYGLAVVKFFCGGEGGSRSYAHASAPAEAPFVETRPPPPLTAPTPPYAVASAPSAPPVADTAPAEEADTTTNTLGPTSAAASSPPPAARLSKKPAELASTKPSKPLGGGPFGVQVGSTTAEGDAKAILDRIRSAHASTFGGLKTRIEQADVHGQHHYRAIITGFDDAVSATRFCSEIHVSNGCIVRR